MKLSQYSDYEKYLLIASETATLCGSYQGFVNLREVLQVIRTMCSKQSTTFEYNNNYYTSKLTIGDMTKIINSFDLAKYGSGFDNVKSMANQICIGRI